LKGDRYFRWTPESQIRCLHAYVPGSYAKVYDAVIDIRVKDESLKVALEYEATQKTFARYDKIRQEIENEKRMDVILYVASSWDLMHALMEQFRGTRRPIIFTLLKELKEKRWEAMTYNLRWDSGPLKEWLLAVGEQRRSKLA
jgi:hypothetical protein